MNNKKALLHKKKEKKSILPMGVRSIVYSFLSLDILIQRISKMS